MDEEDVCKGVEALQVKMFGAFVHEQGIPYAYTAPTIVESLEDGKYYGLLKSGIMWLKSSENQLDMNKILKQGPCCFENNLLALHRWERIKESLMWPLKMSSFGGMLGDSRRNITEKELDRS